MGSVTHLHTLPPSQAEEERDYRDWLKKNEGDKDLEGLRSFWGNPLLDKGEQFLRDYILNQGHHDNTELSVPTYDEVVGVASEGSGGSDTEDEEALQEQEEFERKFNFRFEEPESDLVSATSVFNHPVTEIVPPLDKILPPNYCYLCKGSRRQSSSCSSAKATKKETREGA